MVSELTRGSHHPDITVVCLVQTKTYFLRQCAECSFCQTFIEIKFVLVLFFPEKYGNPNGNIENKFDDDFAAVFNCMVLIRHYSNPYQRHVSAIKKNRPDVDQSKPLI